MNSSSPMPHEGNVITRLCVCVALILFAAILLYLTVFSMIATTDMNTNNPPRERVDYLVDSLPVNLLCLAASILLLLLAHRLLRNADTLVVCAVCLGIMLVAGVVWVISVKGAPMQDSAIVTDAAYKITKGDWSRVTTDYFLRCPYQLGFVLYCELILRLFPIGDNFLSIQFVNVLLLVLACATLLRILWMLTHRDSTVKLGALLLVLCLPPVFFCTFSYGVIPALCFSLLGVYQFLKIDRDGTLQSEWKHALLAALFLGIAVCLKKNSMIFFAAVMILSLLRLLSQRKLPQLLLMVLSALCVLGLPAAVQAQYEARADFSFGKGVSMEAWAAMGTYDSYIAPGWYEAKFVVTHFYEGNKDPEAIKELSSQALREHLERFSKDPAYTLSFFHEKTLSQWNEPTYQGLWLAEGRGHYGELGPIASYLHENPNGIKAYMNIYQQGIFVLALLSLVPLLRQRRVRDALLPTVFLGGFCYHLIFEAKSQYCMIYFLMLVPLAAIGFEWLTERASTLYTNVRTLKKTQTI